MNIFVLRAVLPEIPVTTMFRGVIPFIMADFVRTALILGFPSIALWLPSFMK